MEFLWTHTPLLYLTQSIWRDEAFSLLLSQRSPVYFISNLVFEPPLYYLMLHVWMKLFGTGEIAARYLSLLGFTLATGIVILWAEKLFKKHWLSWFFPIFFFFNPHLLYFAFEIRAYSWYIFFAVVSMYAYWEKRWPLYIAATTLGIYTHTYMIIIPAVQILHHCFVTPKERFLRAFSFMALLVSPWLIKVLIDLPKLKESWYFPVDGKIITSVLGNLFLGYEGTPANLWQFTGFVSLVLIILTTISLYTQKNRPRNSFFAGLVFVPLIIILTISLYKPIFVNRYLIPVTIAQIFVVVFALERIKNSILQKILAAGLLIFVLGFNIWYPSRHAKNDIRATVQEIQMLGGPNDVILVDNPLILFETLYYARNSDHVYWYNPRGISFPWYIGDIVFSESRVVRQLPPYPIRAFIIHTDTTFETAYYVPMTANN